MEADIDTEQSTKDTTGIRYLADACKIILAGLSELETLPGYDHASDGYWASRQLADLNLWWKRIGIDGEGHRSIDYRLRDVPNISELLTQVLSWLQKDLKDIQNLSEEAAVPEGSAYTDVIPSEGQLNTEDVDLSDDSSLSFPSLPSSDKSEKDAETDDEASRFLRQKLELKRKIADNVERLQGFTHWIEQAGGKHRKERIELYRGKGDAKFAYEGYQALAISRARHIFENASEVMLERIAESFARRRIRFHYLEKHQKKRAIGIHLQSKPSIAAPQPMKVLDASQAIEKPRVTGVTKPSIDLGNIQDQKTLYSATVNTKLDPNFQTKQRPRAESVMSVMVQHEGFPPPPIIETSSFQCPYCRLEFDCSEAKDDRWKKHVMRDFEPYFCIFESCQTPFDVPQSFDGLLIHLQEHLPFVYHIDEPDGQHKELNEREFDDYMKTSNLSGELLHKVKTDSLKRGTFTFTSCPFCGGYPDTVESLHPDPDSFDAQAMMQKHIKHHMQEISLWLPPYREDISYRGSVDSPVASRRHRLSQSSPDITEEQNIVCDRGECDCHLLGVYDEELKLGEEDWERRTESLEDGDFWSSLIDNPDIYDRSTISMGQMHNDECLKTFILHQAPDVTHKTIEPMIKPPCHPEKYTFGWICAADVVFLAATQLLDELHDIPESISSQNRPKFLALGKIGKHYVAITSKPEFVMNSIESVAAALLLNFTSIRLGLVLTIGGGAPSPKNDIRLGDVVVSTPGSDHSGVVQYDLGKTLQRGKFQPRGHLQSPHPLLRSAVSGLSARHEADGHGYNKIIDRILSEKPRLQKTYSRPDPASDKLYQSPFIHQSGSAGRDDPSHLVARREREDEYEDTPAIHYGLIAIGNQGMQDASLRDRIAAERNVLCFEMESAGLMNILPSLVICGICDYADSHQNKDWQGYAAMTASAYARDLLSMIQPMSSENETKTTEVPPKGDSKSSDTDSKAFPVHSTSFKNDGDKILEWLTPINYEIQRLECRMQIVPGTCTWLLESSLYQKWRNAAGGSQKLFFAGLPGAGKTLATTVVIDDIHNLCSNDNRIGLAYIYFSRYNRYGRCEQSPEGLLANILKQLAFHQSPLPECLISLHRRHSTKETKPSLDELFSCLDGTMEALTRSFFIIDALDECEELSKIYNEFLPRIFELQTRHHLNILISARPIQGLVERVAGAIFTIRASDSDIRKLLSPRLLKIKQPMLDEVIAGITESADGIFLIAELKLKAIMMCRELRNVMKLVRSTHTDDTLHKLYRDAFRRIKSKYISVSGLAIVVLRGITRAGGQIRVQELQNEIALTPGESEIDKTRIPRAKDMVIVCDGLVTIDDERQIIRFAHHSIARFFEQENVF